MSTVEDLLSLLGKCDKINISRIQEQVDEMRKQQYLKQHPYAIFKGKDNKWRTYLPKEEGGRRQVKKSSKKDVEKAVIEYWSDKEENPTLEQLFNEWNQKNLDRHKICGATFDRNKRFYKRHYEDFGKIKIRNLTSTMILDFLEDELANKELTAKSFSGMKSVMTGILKTAKRKRLIKICIADLYEELDITERDFKINIKEDYQEVFTEEEADKILNYLLNNLDVMNTGILLMFLTGIRVGELASLKPCDICDGFIKIRRTETREEDENGVMHYSVKDFPKTKAGWREVAIPEGWDWFLKKLRTLNPFQEYLFMNSLGRRITTSSFRRKLRIICNKLNIYPKSPHKIRKTYGTILMDAGLDKQFILNQMGHTSIIVTEKSYHRNRKTMDKKREMLGEIPDFQLGNIAKK